jgi:hypothetical protein
VLSRSASACSSTPPWPPSPDLPSVPAARPGPRHVGSALHARVSPLQASEFAVALALPVDKVGPTKRLVHRFGRVVHRFCFDFRETRGMRDCRYMLSLPELDHLLTPRVVSAAVRHSRLASFTRTSWRIRARPPNSGLGPWLSCSAAPTAVLNVHSALVTHGCRRGHRTRDGRRAGIACADQVLAMMPEGARRFSFAGAGTGSTSAGQRPWSRSSTTAVPRTRTGSTTDVVSRREPRGWTVIRADASDLADPSRLGAAVRMAFSARGLAGWSCQRWRRPGTRVSESGFACPEWGHGYPKRDSRA